MWLEMSRDEVHGGGNWGFGQSLWSPTRNRSNRKWQYWELLLQVQQDDVVLHLKGEEREAALVGFSSASADGEETLERPPEPGDWAYARSYYRVRLQEFVAFDTPILIYDVFAQRDSELR